MATGSSTSFSELKKDFTKHLIQDLEALEFMFRKRSFETGITRIGAEQEFCLMDYNQRPSMRAMEVLEVLNDPQFTTELALFNLEANLNPLELQGRCFSELENQLIHLLTKANKHAHQLGSKIILTGILPTIRLSDIRIENITPKPRYKLLNDAMLEARGSSFKFHIHGLDELVHQHDSVLFESCNTSFQMHYQLQPEDAIERYNWAQLIAGPMLAACVNSPVFLGKRLWHETRIALFQQATDTRKSSSPLRRERTRVNFGSGWVTGEIPDLFKDAIGRYEILMPIEVEENSLDVLSKGGIPKLKALTTHNGTIYSWNRMCYGTTENKPHLRIECRYVPSGPTIVDETANTAFWIGLMHGYDQQYASMKEDMHFDDVRNNFFRAAKMGMNAQFHWMGKKAIPAKKLIVQELIPLAKTGLQKAGIHQEDIDKYLDIIEQRVKSGKTGARWVLDSYKNESHTKSIDGLMVSIAEGIYQRQKVGLPVHKWSDLKLQEGTGWESKYKYVKQIMNGDLITVLEDDLLDLAINIMRWSNIHHLPVENKRGELKGLLTSDRLLQVLSGSDRHTVKDLSVGDIMLTDVLTADLETGTIEAYQLMKNNEINCLPVVQDQKLVGIVTLSDYADLIDFFFDKIRRAQV